MYKNITLSSPNNVITTFKKTENSNNLHQKNLRIILS